MSRLAARRFRDTITRKRTAPGTYERGQYVPGPVTETDLPASVQPLAIEDKDFVGGDRLEERLKVFVPMPDALVAAFDDSTADRVLIGTREFVVEESRSWPGGHTRARLVRSS